VDEDRCLAEFEARYRREFGLFRDFLIAFYQLQQDERSYFEHAHRLTRHAGTDREAFVELVGGVSASDFSHHLLGDVLAEGAQLQLRGLLGEAAGAEPPMFPGGLVPSPDGRRWLAPDV
jgi:halogenation protein CepH